MILPEPQTRPFSALIAEIDSGQIKIPQFQRDFVWNMQKSAALIDRILKGYPIGSFIFWRTRERLRSVRDLGGQPLPPQQEGEAVSYVLDGQQRLTSLYACLKGISLERENSNRTDDFSKIFINLKAGEDEQIVVTEKIEEEEEKKSYISILDLLRGDPRQIVSYDEKYYDKLNQYKNRITSYLYSIIQIRDTSIDIATEVFTRINVAGKTLTLFQIMVAKTFDYEKGFDLSERFDKLIDNLRPLNYETISDATVLQTVSIIISGECKRKVILGLDRDTFISTWDEAVDAIERAIEYFRNVYRIRVSQLLPYNALVVPFAYYFYKNKDKPTGDKQKYLQDFFWRCSLSGRYSSSVESKLAQDIKRIDDILLGRRPLYDWSIDTSSDFIIKNGKLRVGSSYINAILCIYAYHQPKSFVDDSIINISNDWLKRANSKNYHHFFPRAYLDKKGKEEHDDNHILNITIVDAFLNKNIIRARAPSDYMREFNKKNSKLSETMKSHLIDDLEEFGVWSDNYDSFFRSRAERISRELKERIIEQKMDKKKQPNLKDDYEAEITVAE